MKKQLLMYFFTLLVMANLSAMDTLRSYLPAFFQAQNMLAPTIVNKSRGDIKLSVVASETAKGRVTEEKTLKPNESYRPPVSMGSFPHIRIHTLGQGDLLLAIRDNEGELITAEKDALDGLEYNSKYRNKDGSLQGAKWVIR
jgi:hypothetical protein